MKAALPIALLIGLAGCGDGDMAESDAANEAAVASAAPANAIEEGVAPANEAAPVPATASSQFTSLSPGDCRVIEETTEEGGYWRRACPGAGGFSLETSESDLRQAMTVIAPGGGRHELELSRHFGSGGFSALGDTVEWRGPPASPLRPRTLTFRYNVVEDPDGQRETSYLGVARLEGGKPCVVARIVPGAGQSDEARRIADAPVLPGCLA